MVFIGLFRNRNENIFIPFVMRIDCYLPDCNQPVETDVMRWNKPFNWFLFADTGIFFDDQMSPTPVMMAAMTSREYQPNGDQHGRVSQHSPHQHHQIFAPNTKGLLNAPGQNNCFLNSAVQVSLFNFFAFSTKKTSTVDLFLGVYHFFLMRCQLCCWFKPTKNARLRNLWSYSSVSSDNSCHRRFSPVKVVWERRDQTACRSSFLLQLFSSLVSIFWVEREDWNSREGAQTRKELYIFLSLLMIMSPGVRADWVYGWENTDCAD